MNKHFENIKEIITKDSVFLFEVGQKLYYYKNGLNFYIFENKDTLIIDFINIKVNVFNKEKIEKEKLQNLYDYLYQENFIKGKYMV